MKHSYVSGFNYYDQTLVIIRGLPGSGKSTLANKLNEQNDYVHIETDMWWYRNANKEYKFDFEKLNHAHRWAQQTVEAFLASERSVIISNTNLTFKDIQPYVHFAHLIGASIDVYSMDRDVNYGSIHGVPKEVMERMYNKMEDHDIIVEKIRAYKST